MSEFSLYGGPSLQTAKADPGVAARAANGDQGQVLGASVQKAEEAVQGSAEAFARISDFGEMQRQEVELRRIRDESDAKFSRMLAFAPGTKESVFEKDGSIRQGKLKDLAYEFGQKIDALGGSFFHPESAMKAEAVRASVRSSLPERYWGLAAKHQLGVARQAFDTSLKLAEEKQDWGGYERSVDDAVASGTISRDEGELRLLRGRKKASRHHFENLAATNPGGAYDFLDSDYCQSLFAPYERDEMRRNLARKARPAAADSFFSSFVLTRKKGKGTSGTKDDGPEWTGFYTARECGWIRAFQAGRADEARPQITAAAAEEARAFNPSLSEEQSEVARDAFIQKYSRFGLDKEWLSRQWGDADRMRKELKTPTIDVKGRLDFLEKRGALLNQGAFNAENQPYSNEDGWESGGKFRDEFMGQLGLTGTETPEKARDKYMAYARANHAAGLRAQVSERFHSWRTTEGKDATLAEQQAKLIDIVREITGNRDVSFVDEGVNLMDSRIESARDAQRTKFYQWAAKNARRFWVDSTERAAPMQRVRLGFDFSRKDLPAGVLLPKSMMEGVDQKNAVVEATFDNDHFRRFRIVGACEGDVPVMTYAVAREGFYDKGRSYAVDMRIIKGDPDQLMKEQEAALPAGKSVKLNKSALGGLAPYGQAFIDAGRKYGMTPDQVKIGMAIAMLETGKGTSSAFRNKNNSMGISPNGGGPRSFGSVEEGIDYGMRNLKRNYFDKGLTTIEQIGAVYAPIGADNDPRNLNQHWVKGVRKYRSSL